VTITNVTAGGNVTISSGTANGVAYLNGSKILTTGSALVFDGTNVATTGTLTVGDSTAPTGLTPISVMISTNTSSGQVLNVRKSCDTALGSSISLMKSRGTAASPVVVTAGDTAGGVIYSAFAGTNYRQLASINGTVESYVSDTNISGYLVFNTNSASTGTAERMRIDSSGNLGLGVTPNAWSSSFKVFQVSSTALYNNGFNDTFLGANFYNDTGGTNRYINSDLAAAYGQVGGAHLWFTAPLGTGGDPITFTQAMTLDASGNLGVAGQTAPSTPLTTGTWGNGLAVGTTSGTNGIVVVSSTSSALSALRFGDGGGGGAYDQGFINYDHSVDALALGTNRTERARIDSSGNFSIKTATNADGNALNVVQTTSSTVLGLKCGTAGTGAINFYNSAGAYVTTVTVSGTTVTYPTSSDYRLKDNISPMTGALAKVAALKPCTYTWKQDGSEGQGFIAHELQEVIPQAVVGEKDAFREDGAIKPQGIDTSFLVATLTAAIQEQQALIQSLTARLDAANI